MEVPVSIITAFVTIIGGGLITSLTWGFSVIKKNTMGWIEFSRVMGAHLQKDADDEKANNERHAVVTKRLDDHACRLKDHEKELIILKTIKDMSSKPNEKK